MAADPLDFLRESNSSEEASDPLAFLGKGVSKGQSLASAPLKGLIKGAAKFSPLPSFGPVSGQLGERMTEQMLPTKEGGLEDILEFAGENIPLAALGEGGLLKKGMGAIAGGLAKAGAKEMNLPEWAQDIVGGFGMAAPSMAQGALSKTLRPSKAQSAVVNFLKDKGFTDKEITPIIQDKKKLSWLSKGAMKYEEKAPWLKGIQDKLGGIYSDIRAKGQTGNYLQGQPLRDFESKFHGIADKLPKRHRRLVEKEVEELFNNPIDFTSLQDFNVAVNDIIKAATGGKASIGKLKVATHEAQKGLDPALFKDLRSTDEAYSKLMNYTDKMTTNNWQNLVKAGQAGAALYGMLTLNPAFMKAAAITGASQYGLRQVLSNPRLQNIHSKMWDAFLKNKMPQALKLAELLKEEMGDKSEDSS